MSEFPEASYNINDEVIDIISTRDTFGGSPRLDGHRIAIYHILSFYRTDHSIEDIAGEDVYPHLSEEQVRAALHYSVDYPKAVERSSKPRDTPLKLDVSFDTREGGPTLAVFDLSDDETGPIAEANISIDDLPDKYSDRDLHAAWVWMFEQGDRPAQSDDSGNLGDAKQRLRSLIDPYRDREDLTDEEAAKIQA